MLPGCVPFKSGCGIPHGTDSPRNAVVRQRSSRQPTLQIGTSPTSWTLRSKTRKDARDAARQRGGARPVQLRLPAPIPIRLVLPFYPGMTVYDALYAVGGPTPFARAAETHVVRAGERIELDAAALWDGDGLHGDLPLLRLLEGIQRIAPIISLFNQHRHRHQHRERLDRSLAIARTGAISPSSGVASDPRKGLSLCILKPSSRLCYVQAIAEPPMPTNVSDHAADPNPLPAPRLRPIQIPSPFRRPSAIFARTNSYSRAGSTTLLIRLHIEPSPQQLLPKPSGRRSPSAQTVRHANTLDAPFRRRFNV